MEVVRLDVGQHVGAMSELLHAAHASHAPLGANHRFADLDAAHAAVQGAVAAGAAYGVFDGPGLAGYFVAPAIGYLGIAHHAVRSSDRRDLYRMLYGAAAADLAADGVTHHSVPVLADDRRALRTFVELEFGVDQIDGLLEVPPIPTHDLDGHEVVRRATRADLDVVVELASELQQFHRRSPMFQPADAFDAAGIRRGAELALDDPASAVVVAELDGRVVAMAQAGPSSAYTATFDIGMNVVTEGVRTRGIGTAMLELLLGWGATRGYGYASVGWTSSNPVSDRFYRARGFSPVRYRLHRRIVRRAVLGD